jgi:hypothetical protein
VNLTEQTLNVHPSVLDAFPLVDLDEVKALIEENKESVATGGNDQDGTLTSQLEEFKEICLLLGICILSTGYFPPIHQFYS